MDRSAAKAMSQDELIFHDGIGDRFLVRDTQGRPLHESLVLRPDLTSVPSFEFTLNDRLTKLDGFEHDAFVTVRQVMRMPGAVPRLTMISDHAAGARLATLLADREHTGKPLAIGTALFLIREILDAVSVLHRHPAGVSHGALGPERIIILADGRIRIAEYVLGSAIEQLRYTPERYWKDLRVTVPLSAGGVRFDRRVDVAQIGMIAVALIAGRPLRDYEHLSGVGDLLMGLSQTTNGQHKPLAQPLRGWLVKALHMDLRRTFATAVEAGDAFDEAMTDAGLTPNPSDKDITGSRPHRIVPAQPKTPPPTKAVTAPPVPPVAAPPQKPAVKQTMAPAKTKTRADAWDTPGADTREYGYHAGTLAPDAKRSRLTPKLKGYLKLGVLGVLIALAFTAAQYIPPPSKLFSTNGTLIVETKPLGIRVLVDGQERGVTPLTLTLTAGRHEVELRSQGRARVFNVFVTKGDRISQYVEFPSTPSPRTRK